MSRQLLAVIQNTLVRDEGLHVIMTTHAPATVAVAPEESLYAMEPEVAGLKKVTKTQALAVLTSELPTLSIGFDGRRQVFVESATDAELYELLQRTLRATINSERSLVFIGAGRRRESGGDVNAGCAQVQRIVTELVNAGNTSVFGLVDWDGERTEQGRVHVLARGERYAIENCLLDPLLLGALAVRENPAVGPDIGLQEGERFIAFRTLDADRLQDIANRVQARVLGTSIEELGPARDAAYAGGSPFDCPSGTYT